VSAICLSLAGEPFGYLTTTGRNSGEPREIEIWFALKDEVAYLMARGRDRAHWVRNLLAEPTVALRIATETAQSRARVVRAGTPEDVLARRLLLAKYGPGHATDLSEWARRSLPIAVEFRRDC